jgi:hypothetical protein
MKGDEKKIFHPDCVEPEENDHDDDGIVLQGK